MLQRKLMLFVLVMVLVFTMVTGCTQNQDDTKETTKATTKEATKATTKATTEETAMVDGPEELVLPIVNEPLTLSFWIGMNPATAAVVENYGQIEAMKVIEEKTGITIDWKHPPAAGQTEQFNIMVTTGDLPDIIEYFWNNYAGGPTKLIEDNVLISLNDLIAQYSPNLYELMQKDPLLEKDITTSDGTLFVFPSLMLDPMLEGPYYGPQIRKDWLDKLGLDVPETLDDLYNVLVAFRDNDPNGNGQKDEIPFVAHGSDPVKWFMNAWGLTPQYGGFYVDGKKIEYSYMRPEYKEYLATIAKWYKESLIDPDYIVTDKKLFDSLVTTNKAGVYWGYPASYLAGFTNLMKPDNPEVHIIGIQYPSLNKGEKVPVVQKNNRFANVGAGLTSSNKHLKESAKLLDFRYSEEGQMLLDFGIEGKSYTMKEGKAVYTDEVLNNPTGLPFSEALAKYALIGNQTRLRSFQAEKQGWTLDEQAKAMEAWFIPSRERNLPNISISPDSSDRFAEIMTEINTYVEETLNKVIMGIIPLEDFDFDNYVKTLKDMGIEEAKQMQQSAYDMYINK